MEINKINMFQTTRISPTIEACTICGKSFKNLPVHMKKHEREQEELKEITERFEETKTEVVPETNEPQELVEVTRIQDVYEDLFKKLRDGRQRRILRDMATKNYESNADLLNDLEFLYASTREGTEKQAIQKWITNLSNA